MKELTGVSPELVEIVLKRLRKEHGKRPLTHSAFFAIEYSLREIECAYMAPPTLADEIVDPAVPLSKAVARIQGGQR